MDSRFIATPSTNSVEEALKLWPELSGQRIRPLLVTAFGDIFVELTSGEIWLVDTMSLACERIAESPVGMPELFTQQDWSAEHLLTELALLAAERGIKRHPHQVFGVAPHPCFSGKITVDQLVAMDLVVWHHICAQLRVG